MIRKNYTFLALFIFINCWVYSQTRIVSQKVSVNTSRTQFLENILAEYELHQIDLNQFRRNRKSQEKHQIIWTLSENRNLNMTLFPNEIRSSRYIQGTFSEKGLEEIAKEEVNTYQGYLSNNKRVSLTIDNDFIYGGVETDDGYLMIEQLKHFLNDKNIPDNILITYNSDKLKIGFVEDFRSLIVCGNQGFRRGALRENDPDNLDSHRSSDHCNILELALDADFEWVQRFGNNSINQMLAEINMVQLIYERDLDLSINVTTAILIPGNEYTSFTGNGILSEIQDVWFGNSPLAVIHRDIVHHFTDKQGIPSSNGNTLAGQASNIGDACNSGQSRSFTIRLGFLPTFLTVAHELGHNLNGVHGNGEDCNTGGISGPPNTRTIMCATAPTLDQRFSNATISRITNFINSRSCFNPGSIAFVDGDISLCVNETSTYSLENYEDLPGTTINWTTNNGRLAIISGQGTPTVSVSGQSNGASTLTANIDFDGPCDPLPENLTITVGSPPLQVQIFSTTSSGITTFGVTGGTPPYDWEFISNSTTSGTTNTSTTVIFTGCNGGLLRITGSDSCGDLFGQTFVSGCGFGSECSGCFTIAPNPVVNEINLIIGGNETERSTFITYLEDELKLSLYDFNNNLVKEKEFNDLSNQNIKMDVTGLKKGNYILKITSNNTIETRQVLIN